MPRRMLFAALFGFFLYLAHIVKWARAPTLPGTVPRLMSISIVTPTANQVFQRNSLGEVDIAITGTYSGAPVSIEADFAGQGYFTIAHGGGTFSGNLVAEAGQGTLTVRFSDTPSDKDTLANISVGDVFFVIGQSNASGWGLHNQSYSSPAAHPSMQAMMWRLDDDFWTEMTDPTGSDGGSGGSCWPALATLHMADQGAPFCIVNAAVGATGLVNGEWGKGGDKYNQALGALTQSGVNAVKAMLWHQGETDVSEQISQSAYQSALSQMVDDMQTDNALLAGVKLVCAQIGDRNEKPREDVDAIRLAQQNRWNNDPDILAGPVLHDVNLNDGDGVHFGSGSDSELDILAQRWWRMLDYHYYGGTQGRAPRFAGATRNGLNITVTFTGGVSPLNGQTDTTGWRFTDNGVDVAITAAAASGSRGVTLTIAAAPTGIGLLSWGSNEDAHDTLLLDSGAYPMPPEPFIDQPLTGAIVADTQSAAYDPTFAFYVDVEDSGGIKYGSGPLRALDWHYSTRFDRAGTFSCRYLASDAQAAFVTSRRYLRAWALLNGVWTEVGFGRVDNIGTSLEDGRAIITASGLDVTTELGDVNVGDLEIGKATDDLVPVAGATHAEALDIIGSFARMPDGWALLPAETPANDYLYARFGGESILGALIHLAERTQTHFYRGTGRELVFTSEFESSGMRAIQVYGQLAAQTCAISLLSWSVDTHDYLSRITPFGAGTGKARLTMRASDRAAPLGFSFDRQLNYIENDDATATFGYKDHPQVEFKEITAISNTDADLRAAANMLFDAALAELRRRSNLADQRTYELAVTGCSVLLHPMQTIRVVYWDSYQGIDVDEDLLILEATWEVDGNGVRTSRLVVSTDDRWPESDESAAAERAVNGRVFIAHPQIGPTEWWSNKTLYVGASQAEHVDVYPFVLSKRVTQVNQIVFQYSVKPVLSLATFVAGNAAFEISGLAVTINNSTIEMDIEVEIEGDITLDEHTHPIPNHGHEFQVVDVAAGWPTLHLYDGGFTAIGALGASGTVPTDPATGAVTSSGGGDGTFDITATATATGTGTGEGSGSGSGTVDLSGAIRTSYGIFRAPASDTYDLDELEMNINGWGQDVSGNWGLIDDVTYFWVNLADGIPVEGGRYEIDITEPCSDESHDFRPRQRDNLIEVRRAGTVGDIAIDGILGDFSTGVAAVSISPLEYADFGLATGDPVTISGTINFDGTYAITVNPSYPTAFFIYHEYVGAESGGTAIAAKSVMILGMLGVATTIQSIAIT